MKTIDVSALPQAAFDSRSVTWWATIGLLIAETMTLAIAAVTYLYLMVIAPAWPPEGTAPPALTVPTVSLVFLMLSGLPMIYVDLAARRKALRPVRRGLVIATLMGVASMTLRLAEIPSLNTRWDANAYGSIVYTNFGLHALDILAGAVETIVITVIMWSEPLEDKYFVDVSESAFAWYVLVVSWLPIYPLLYLVPHVF